MPELIAKSALAGQPPLTLAGLTLAEVHPGPITSVAPFPGQADAVAHMLKPLGLSFPAPNRVVSKDDARLVWAGRDLAFLIGAPAPDGLAAHAALTDQTDGWATLSLAGTNVIAALSRLVPIDLRTVEPGGTARTALNHMQVILIHSGPDSFDIMVFRSMARTAWHELHAVLTALHARAALT